MSVCHFYPWDRALGEYAQDIGEQNRQALVYLRVLPITKYNKTIDCAGK
jgi:hypothetical protein